MSLRTLTVVGARPEFVQTAPLAREIARREGISGGLVHTGQHYDYEMSELFFSQLELPEPLYHLGIGSASHGVQTGAMLTELDRVYLTERPEIVITHGDTNSTLAAALSAAKLGITVAHVEAGLRSWNRLMPEELNRVVTDHLADLLFCPSETSVANLQREGITSGVFMVGDLMRDSLEWTMRTVSAAETMRDHGLLPGKYFFATIHRAENTDDRERLTAILAGLGRVARTHPVILPAHPRTRPLIRAAGVPGGIRVIDPVGHSEAMALAQQAAAVLTDSGGLQKEVYWLETPCVTIRDETEWVETVDAGWNRLAHADPHSIEMAAREALGPRPAHPDLYGDGNAAGRIVDSLLNYATGGSDG
ncbi:MAG: UDP-N-acetylglucosamine 2-epimerase (non-hydrolyzing) [Acidimicrobiia bacterium]|nr:UDP-N-acetylglucosamine 2-epimerase (non-hydrolyzing) [Acidimicrobiia bacterium]